MEWGVALGCRGHPPSRSAPSKHEAVKNGWASACLPTHPLGHLEGPEAQGGGPGPVTRIAAPSHHRLHL